ncbi:hypothetical protein N5C12_15365 [Comamonas aquatica]|uniref:hypothetical protein n=1 Tax=Comamonas aquatica TaxID=225991 RepID=UPI00244D6448|nr:hypothetical protein [Comamonas aquatica]MDH0900723.1 hypothetical protein [Comamonas aquatica]
MADKAQNPVQPAKKADWERIEIDYRAGVKSLREIAGEHGISEGAIRKRAKRDGWPRDLADKIQQRAEDLVRTQAVRTEVRSEQRATERQVIEANAEAVANVKMAHRSDISRARAIVNGLLDELQEMVGSDNATLLQELGDLLRSEDENGKDRLNDLYQQIISLPGRSKAMKDLTASLQSLVAMERTAYGMDEKAQQLQGGVVKDMTDAERAVRLANLLSKSPGALTALHAGLKGEQA